MSHRLTRHPEEEQLLRFADGELAASAAAEIRLHLEECWQCRTELQELHTVIGECVKYRKNVLRAYLPPPPAPWGDLYRRFAQADASLRHRSMADRMVQILEFPVRHARRWAPAAVAVAVIFALVHQFVHAPAAQAAELLRKAIAAADAKPSPTRRLRIRTRTHQFTRPQAAGRQLAADSDAQASVAALFLAAHYSWDDPLSARSFQAWRDQLPDKRDEVAAPNDAQAPGQSYYRIETSTGTGDLAQAMLKFSMPDLQPVEGRFEFRNREWVEITEATDTPAPPAEAAAAGNGRLPPASGSVPQPERAPSAVTPATAGDELRVLDGLHQLSADLGDPIQVTRAGGQIVVTGVGISAERQRQLQNLFGAQPNVVLRFSDGAGPPQPADPAMRAPVTTPAEPGLRTRMETQLGGQPYLEQFTRQVLEMSDAMMSRAYALRRLAEEMPPAVEADLSPPDRQLLLGLHRDHTSALARQQAEIERVLDPVLLSLGAPDPGIAKGPISAATWQASTEELFQAARRVDRQLAQMLDVTPGEGAAEQLPAQVRASLAQLRSRVEMCERRTAQALGPGTP